MKTWFRIVDNNGAQAFVAVKREDIREHLARMLKPIEIAKIAEPERNEDSLYEAYCRALAEGDRIIDVAEGAGQLDVGAFKFRFVAL